MGSGSSAFSRKRAYIEARDAAHADSDIASDEPSVRPCDRCGETRRTARFGGETAQWLCAACQLQSDIKPASPQCLRLPGAIGQPELEPRMRRHGTARSHLSSHPTSLHRRHERRLTPTGEPINAIGEAASAAVQRKGRRGMCKVASGAGEGGGEGTQSQQSGPQMGLKELRLKHQATYGDLRFSVREVQAPSKSSQNDAVDSPNTSGAEDAGNSKIPELPKRALLAGFKTGDKVQSLITRSRCGTRMLELGQLGTVVGALVRGVNEEKSRILVQFAGGVSWWLTPGQITLQSTYSFIRSRGLVSLSWGNRVRSLVSYLNPPPGGKHIHLGDAGTVIGPGTVVGKLAVKFDEQGEWSIWPSTICEADSYPAVVAEALAGCFYRGDRVRAKEQLRGHRCGGDAEQKSLCGEEVGTVIGAGHTTDKVLVHFDSDDNVWSLAAEYLEPVDEKEAGAAAGASSATPSADAAEA